MADYTPEFLSRFWSKVNRTDNPDECWLWTGDTTHNGYGRVGLNYKTVRAHRIAYDITHDDLTPDLLVLHTCDTPACCNPNHLFSGTQLENMQDCINKGRKRYVKGEQHGQCKLSDSQITDIRYKYNHEGLGYRKLAKIFNVSPSRIRQIVKRKDRSST